MSERLTTSGGASPKLVLVLSLVLDLDLVLILGGVHVGFLLFLSAKEYRCQSHRNVLSGLPGLVGYYGL